MRVAALYDIHGNLPALEAVLREVRDAGVERIVIGGDVLPGPMPRECLTRLLDLDLPIQFIRGNGDREVIAPTGAVPEAYRASMRWNAAQLSAAEIQIAGALAADLHPDDGLGDVLFCHATPRNDMEIFTRLTPDQTLVPIFATLGVGLVVCGHTHMQFDRTVGTVRVVNAGSVGMPFGEPGAYWLLLGPDVQLRRTGTIWRRPRREFARRVIRTRTNSPHAMCSSRRQKPICSRCSARRSSRSPVRTWNGWIDQLRPRVDAAAQIEQPRESETFAVLRPPGCGCRDDTGTRAACCDRASAGNRGSRDRAASSLRSWRCRAPTRSGRPPVRTAHRCRSSLSRLAPAVARSRHARLHAP